MSAYGLNAYARRAYGALPPVLPVVAETGNAQLETFRDNAFDALTAKGSSDIVIRARNWTSTGPGSATVATSDVTVPAFVKGFGRRVDNELILANDLEVLISAKNAPVGGIDADDQVLINGNAYTIIQTNPFPKDGTTVLYNLQIRGDGITQGTGPTAGGDDPSRIAARLKAKQDLADKGSGNVTVRMRTYLAVDEGQMNRATPSSVTTPSLVKGFGNRIDGSVILSDDVEVLISAEDFKEIGQVQPDDEIEINDNLHTIVATNPFPVTGVIVLYKLHCRGKQ